MVEYWLASFTTATVKMATGSWLHATKIKVELRVVQIKRGRERYMPKIQMPLCLNIVVQM